MHDKTAAEVLTPFNAQRSDHGRDDHVVTYDGKRYAGNHLLIDLVGGQQLDNLDLIEMTLRDCVAAAGATLLHIHMRHFMPNGGVSGIAVLAESHISIHSWPEHEYAALDLFMCGTADPRKALPVLQRAFCPREILVQEHKRGIGRI